MLFVFGLLTLFFLPLIESLSRDIGFILLLFSVLLLFFSQFKTRWFASEKIVGRENDLISSLWILLLISITISTIFSGSFVRSCIELVRYFALFFIFNAIRNYPDREQIIKQFFIPMILVNSLILCIINFAYFIPFVKIPIPTNGMNLFYPSFGHNRIAELLVYPLSILVIIFFSDNRWRKYAIISLYFFAIFFLASSARATFFVFSICLLLTISSKVLPINIRIFKIGLIVVMTSIVTAALFLLLFINISSNSNIINKATYFFSRPLGIKYRIDYVQQAIKGTALSPLIGNGPDTFVFISKIYSSQRAGWSNYAHNHYIQLFSDTGLLGGVIFLVLNIILFISPIKKLFKKQLTLIEIGILLGVTSSALHSFFDFDWQFNSLFIIYLIGLGVLNHNHDNQISHRKKAIKEFILPGLMILFLELIIVFFFQHKKINLLNTNTFSDQNLSIPVLKQLLVFNRLDSKIPDLLFVKFNDQKEYQDAHLWNQKTILLSGFHGESVMKRDYLLYLSQARDSLEKNDYVSAVGYLSKANSIYPFFQDKIGGAKYITKAVNYFSQGKKQEAISFIMRYIDLFKLRIPEIFLADWQILYIIDKLR